MRGAPAPTARWLRCEERQRRASKPGEKQAAVAERGPHHTQVPMRESPVDTGDSRPPPQQNKPNAEQPCASSNLPTSGRSVTRPPPTPGSRHPADPPSWRMSRSAARAHRWWPPSPPNPSPSPRTHGPSRRGRLPRPTTVDARPHHPRDSHCIFPRCQVDARSCDLDHSIPDDPDGPPGQTRADNLAALCRRHHRAKPTGRWRYTRTPDGDYTWHGPYGTTYLVTARGARGCPDRRDLGGRAPVFRGTRRRRTPGSRPGKGRQVAPPGEPVRAPVVVLAPVGATDAGKDEDL